MSEEPMKLTSAEFEQEFFTDADAEIYNQLLRIEEELGEAALHAGSKAFVISKGWSTNNDNPY